MKKSYVKPKVTDFDIFIKSPFIDDMAQYVKSNLRTKKVNVGVAGTFINNAGESTVVRGSKVVPVDKQRYVKLYITGIDKIYAMPYMAVKVLMYMSTHLKKDAITVDFDRDDCKKVLKCSTNGLFDALAELMYHSIIHKTKWKFMYWINPMVIFNGDRRPIAQEALKDIKDNNGHEVHNGQLEIDKELNIIGKRDFDKPNFIDDFD